MPRRLLYLAGCGCLNRAHSYLSIFFGAITTTLAQVTTILAWSIVIFFFSGVLYNSFLTLQPERSFYVKQDHVCPGPNLPVASHYRASTYSTNNRKKSVKNLPAVIVDLFIYTFSSFSFSSCVLKFCYYLHTHLEFIISF